MYVGRGLLSFASRTAMAVPAPSGVSVGDVIVIHAAIEDFTESRVIAGPGDTLYPAKSLEPEIREATFGVIHDGSATYPVTWDGASLGCEASSFGFSERSKAFLTSAAAEGIGTAAATGGVTTPSAGYDLLAIVMENAGVLATPPAGMTERLDTAEGGMIAQHAATVDGVALGATGAKTFSLASSTIWGARLIAVAPGGPRPGSLGLLGVGR